MEVHRVVGFVEVDKKGGRVWEVRAKVVEGVDVVGCGLPLSFMSVASVVQACVRVVSKLSTRRSKRLPRRKF